MTPAEMVTRRGLGIHAAGHAIGWDQIDVPPARVPAAQRVLRAARAGRLGAAANSAFRLRCGIGSGVRLDGHQEGEMALRPVGAAWSTQRVDGRAANAYRTAKRAGQSAF